MTIFVPFDGVVKKLMYKVGETATKGEPLMTIEQDGEQEEVKEVKQGGH